MAFGPKITAFLASMKVMPVVSRAAKAAGIRRATHYDQLKRSKAYEQAFRESRQIGLDYISDIAIRRSAIGWNEPIVYQGNFTYPDKWDEENHRWIPDTSKPPLTVRRIDNRLLEFVLRALHPDYQEQVAHKVSGNVGVTKFEGTLEELLAVYKQLTMQPPDAQE